MNKNLVLLGLVLGALFFLRNKQSAPARPAGLIGVNTQAPGFGGFDVDDPW